MSVRACASERRKRARFVPMRRRMSAFNGRHPCFMPMPCIAQHLVTAGSQDVT